MSDMWKERIAATIGLALAFSWGCSGNNGKVEVGSTDGDADADGDADGDTDSDRDTFDECAAVSETADNAYQPLDIVFTIDNTPSMLDEINTALKNGHVSGQQFHRLRKDAMDGIVRHFEQWPTSWRQALRRWADQALSRRLISVTEKQELENRSG